jgi:allophanate hydrolase
LRIGVPDSASRKFGGDALSEVAFDAALRDLASATGAQSTAPIDMSSLFAAAHLLYSGPWVAERYHAVRGLIESAPDELHPTTLKIISAATNYSAADAFDGLYKLADLRRKAEVLWKSIDVLAVPTFPRPRTVADLDADPVAPNSELGTYTNFVNLLDLCALAVPSRFRGDGFPSGVTLIAPRGQDGLLATLGAHLHATAGVPIGATGMVLPAEPPQPVTAAPGEIELAVVGAHLSGMPLNPELTSRGARFLRAGPTAADYRLFALAGGPPFRPGLMRVAAGTGFAIATEVWALTPDALGSFMAGVPAPLGIGTTSLADGTTPKGFIVEAEGVVGARDISEFGGWRNFIASRH